MILTIENLGALKHIEIDLSKKFILFCGPNNTGKTYVSYILYSFIYLFSRFHPKNLLSQFFKDLETKGEINLKKEYIEKYIETACDNFKSDIPTIFGISDENSENLFKDFKIRLSYTDEDYKHTLHRSVNTFTKSGTNLIKFEKEQDSTTIKITVIDTETQQIIAFSPQIYSNFLLHFTWIIKSVILGYYEFPRMLTVERNSIYTFKTELSISRNELIDQLQQSADKTDSELLNIINSSTRRYPLAIRNSLRIANDLENLQKQTSDYSEISKEIEQGLLGGNVSVSQNGDVEFHASGMADNQSLPFHLSSSIVKTMASLVIYLKHLAHKGDTLIIDEPEMNFHPDVQVLLAQIFAKLSNQGLQIVISTHSDYIIREVNNMIMAGCLIERGQSKEASKAGYQPDCTLKKDNVEVQFFHQTSKDIIATRLPIDDDGFAVETIDNVIIRQNQRAEYLYDCLNQSSK